MRRNSAKQIAEPSAQKDLAALERLAEVSRALSTQDQQATIEALNAQLVRYETAMDKISQGVCFFDGDERLIVSNRRYAEIYNLRSGDVVAGTSLRSIAERRASVGTCPMAVDDYLAWCRDVNSEARSQTKDLELRDGRTIHISHQPMPGGGWVATHEDVTEIKAKKAAVKDLISLQTLIDWVPDYMWVKDLDSRFVVVNKALAADSGKAHASELIGLRDEDLHPSEAARRFRAVEQELIRSGKPVIDMEENVLDAAGVEKWVLSTKVPLRDAQNKITGMVGIARDITNRRKADLLRSGQARILEMIAMSAPLEEVLKNLVLLIESQLTGIRCSVLSLENNGMNLRHAAGPNLPQGWTQAIDGLRIGPDVGSCGTAVYRRETVIVTDIQSDPLWKNYRDLAVKYGFRSCWSTPILSHNGAVLGTLAMYSETVREPTAIELNLFEVSTRIAGIAIERRQAEDRIHFLANHDVLTGLPNRSLLMDRLSQAVLQASRHDTWVTVVFLDLDNFKAVNDNLGHNAGDELLKAVASRMTGCLRSTDTVVRLGGDEFVIVLSDLPKSTNIISEKLQKLRSAIAETVSLDGHDFHVTASIGIANFPNDGIDADTLLANADAAMYRAKEMGRDNFQFYTPEINLKVHEKFKLQEELREAVTRSEFILHYQPQADLRTGKVFAVEALLRWNHPTQGLLAPLSFISLAEETGMIVPIGDWVLHEACRQNKAWQDAGLEPMVVCVNVSTRQFKERSLISRVVHALEESGLAAKYLELEITESLIMQDVEQAISTMKELAGLGVHISIDDFGTGYSSLSALKSFPVTRLKIDKSFITNLSNNDSDKAVASAVISLGQKLNLRVIAEGVETNEQISFLRDNNCHEIQGYHFSRPIESSALETLLRSRMNQTPKI